MNAVKGPVEPQETDKTHKLLKLNRAVSAFEKYVLQLNNTDQSLQDLAIYFYKLKKKNFTKTKI